MTSPDEDQTLEINAYAVAYRLLGDRPSARAVSGIAAERVRQAGGLARPDWLYLLVEFTLDQMVGPSALPTGDPAVDQHSGLRVALRRRLERAAPDERVAGSLVHLAGYPVDFVADIVHRTPEQTEQLAGLLAPPPGIAYRDLGDPELTGRAEADRRQQRRRRGPHWTTVAAVALIIAVVIAATQITGPRPTLGPPLEENGVSAEGWAPDPGDE